MPLPNLDEVMDWKAYEQNYAHFRLSLALGDLLAHTTAERVRDFPHRLPTGVRLALNVALRWSGHAGTPPDPDADAVLQRVVDELFTPGDTTVIEAEEAVAKAIGDCPLPVSVSAVWAGLAFRHLGLPITKVNLEWFLASQRVIMAYAHLEAFLANTVRAICCAQPGHLKRRKAMAWEDILQAGSVADIAVAMIEELVLEFTHQSFKDQIACLREHFGLELTVSPEVEMELNQGAIDRNLLVHNGGRVNQAYRKATGRTDLKIGAWLPVPEARAHVVSQLSAALGEDVFIRVAEKCFSKQEDGLALTSSGVVTALGRSAQGQGNDGEAPAVE